MFVPCPTATYKLLPYFISFPCVEKIVVPNPVHVFPSNEVPIEFVPEPTAKNILYIDDVYCDELKDDAEFPKVVNNPVLVLHVVPSEL